MRSARTLRADYLLEGSVRREADRVRITAQLVETRSEAHLWTDAYERSLTDCLSVQAEVAARIARSLAVELLPEQPVQSSHDAAAYQTYLKGRYYWNLPGDQGLPQAIEYFGQACARNPTLPQRMLIWRGPIRHVRESSTSMPRTALETARPIAERALKLDRHLAHAHLAVAQHSRDARLGVGRGRSRIPAGDRAQSEQRWRTSVVRAPVGRPWADRPKRFAKHSARTSWIRCAWSRERARHGHSTWRAITRPPSRRAGA